MVVEEKVEISQVEVKLLRPCLVPIIRVTYKSPDL
jgi:hypothetical protein